MIDSILQLKDLAVATRTRKLSDRLMQEANSIYKALNIDFEIRWFTMFYLLSYCEKPMSILDIASSLGVTHPAVNQMAQEMLDRDLIYASMDSCDRRKRLLALSEKGRQLLPILEIIWKHKIASIKGVLVAIFWIALII
jgi:DNA-binding MarR family transcriptional regulator